MTDVTNEQLNAIVPGVTDAYGALLSRHHRGIHTSTGSFYNHTFFGRDASMTAKFMVDIDPSIARDVISELVRLQGIQTNKWTQEEPGRIHHEWRDFKLWRGTFIERMMLKPWKYLWGGNSRLLLTYFAVDSTASYIRLVHKYATHIDESILEMEVRDKNGRMTTVGESITKAANWLCDQMIRSNLVETKRSNPFSLPFQTYQDSLTAYSRLDGSLAKYRHHIGYVENQAFLADALYDVCHLLPDSEHAERWQIAQVAAENGLFQDYWQEDTHFLAACIDEAGPLDREAVSSGWTLNVSSWESLPEAEQQRKIAAIVRRLFSDDFLTPVGLRSRAYTQPPILKGVTEYHGRQTVWPMFSFMVIEGLRRHCLYNLADQLEWRMLNGLNASGQFDEFFIVERDGSLLLETDDKPARTVSVQMPVEKRIAFSIVPALIAARRTVKPTKRLAQADWQQELEREVLKTIDTVELMPPDDARRNLPIVPVRLKRFQASLRTTLYFTKESLKR